MQECRFCKGTIKNGDPFCKYCGYDPKTDRMSPDFIPTGQPVKPLNKKAVSIFSAGISPGVKNFAFIGLAILIFSILYKNHFNINNVVSEVKYYFTMISKGKFKIGESKRSKKIEWIDVMTFEENADRAN